MEHRGTEGIESGDGFEASLTGDVIGAAIRVHRVLGPGLLESVYECCLERELVLRSRSVRRQVILPVEYRGVVLPCSYRADLEVDGKLLVEVKAVTRLEPIHLAQMLTYLRLAKLRLGLLINFNVSMLRDGVRRVLNG